MTGLLPVELVFKPSGERWHPSGDITAIWKGERARDLELRFLRPASAGPATHFWRLRKTLPERHRQPCRVLARGRMNSILIQFEDGTRHIVSRYAVRKLPA